MSKDYVFDIEKLQNEVEDFIHSVGIEPLGTVNFTFDGSLHRFKVNGDKHGEETGWYVLHLDGWPAGTVGDWRKGIRENWKFDIEKLPDKNRKFFNNVEIKKSIERRKKLDNELEEKFNTKADRTRIYFETLPIADITFPYLQKKDILPLGGIRYCKEKNALAVPLYNINGIFRSLQWIYEDGTKRFEYETSTKGVFLPLGFNIIENEFDKGNEKPIIIGEGIATVITIYSLLDYKYPCVAAMNCGNLLEVARNLKERYPNRKIIIAADNDIKTDGNPGLTAANEAKEKLDLYGVIYPKIEGYQDGSDWNDYKKIHGNDETQKALVEELKLIPVKEKQEKYRKQAEKLGVMAGSSFDEFCTPVENDNWLIEDWLPSESLVMMFAPSGSGKGFLAIDMAFSVACPYLNEWHGKKILQHGGVVYLAGEGQRGMKKRCAGLANYKGIPSNEINLPIITDVIPLDEKNPDFGVDKAIANIGLRCPEPQLVVIDTVNCYMMGDENKTQDATAFINACKKIISEFHCTVFVVHHTGQAQDNQGRARGSSVFKAAMDMEYKVSKSGSILTLEMTKSKDTEKQKSLVFRMKEVLVPKFFESDGKQSTTCVLYYDEETSEVVNASLQKPERKIPKAEKFARDTYSEAAKQFGEIVTRKNVTLVTGVTVEKFVCVKLDDWRKVFYGRSAAEGDTRRVLFNRAKKIMLEEQNILFKQYDDKNDIELYCLPLTGNTYEIDIEEGINGKNEI